MAAKSLAELNPHHRRVPDTRRFLQYAAASRILILTLIMLWRSLLSPYDTSASINTPCLSSACNSSNSDRQAPTHILLPRLGSAIENGIVWDSVYFVRIAECGYEYEQSYAFLPLLPICIQLLSKTVFAPLVPVIGHRAVLGLSGYVLNNVAFVFAALYLYRLSVIVLNDPEVALRASILFCFNPASIFYSSIYSESLYALLSFGGLYYFTIGADYCATLCLALSGLARSNGVLNAGYICYHTMRRGHEALFARKQTCLTLKIIVSGVLRVICIFTPFICFQAYGYFNICTEHSVDETSPWCKKRPPLLYNYIQSHYWGVGFLKYFQLKQLPNFLLASPILSLSVCSIVYYVKLWPEVFLSLGLQASSLAKESVGSQRQSTAVFPEKDTCNKIQDDRTLRLRKRAIKGESLFTGPSKSDELNKLHCNPVVLLPFVLHLIFMVGTAFFVMHVQVSTRFLSSSPLLYWFASQKMKSPVIGSRWGYCIWTYCAAYIFLGTVLFSNFYPFT